MLLDAVRFLIVPIILLSPILVLALVGLIWAPAAGTITAWLARKDGMPVLRAFVGGAVASIALLLPWCFLTANFLEWRSAARLAEISYRLIIVLWIVFPLALFALFYGFFVVIAVLLSVWADRSDGLMLSLFFGVLGIAATLMQIAMWNKERRWVSGAKQGDDTYLPGRVTAVPLRHLGPSAGALLWSVVAPTLLVSSVYLLVNTT